MNIQGRAINYRLKCFFFLHVLLKLMLGLNSTGLCVLSCWLNIYSIFLSDSVPAVAEWVAGPADIFRRYPVNSMPMKNRCRVSILAWGVVRTFPCKMLQIENSSRFKSGEYGSQWNRDQTSNDRTSKDRTSKDWTSKDRTSNDRTSNDWISNRTEPRMTEARKWPNLEWPNLEKDRTSN